MQVLELAVVAAIVVAALFYVARSLWPNARRGGGCASCEQHRKQSDDYV